MIYYITYKYYIMINNNHKNVRQWNSNNNENNIDRIINFTESSNSIFGNDQIKVDVHDSFSSTESTSIDSVDSLKEAYSSDENEIYYKKWDSNINTNKNCKPKFKCKKNISNNKIKQHINYIGETVSEFNKNSPFINMLINKRIHFCELGPSCHIAAFVPDLGIENKFTNWAFGKIAIGENSERMRYGNYKLSTHAEIDALKKLVNLIRVKRCKKQKMDLIVIRVNKSGNLCESAPCYHCTKELSKSSIVTINKIYFSRCDGTISCIKYSDWLKNDKFHISKGWKWYSSFR